jgi:starch synthase
MVTISGAPRILFLAAEAEPLIKVGGLGDVAGSLPKAVRRLSLSHSERPEDAIDIRLVIPFHGENARTEPDFRILASYNIQNKQGPVPVTIYDTEIEGVPVYLVSGPPLDPKGSVYSSDPSKDGRKFIFFSLAALELARYIGFHPHIIHTNDWHTAPAAYALSIIYKEDLFFRSTSSLLTVHNLPYLGTGNEEEMEAFGLPAAAESGLPTWAQQLPLPTGLYAANHISTVSPTYAKEILTPEFGSGLDRFLLTRHTELTGILNGLDVESWDPATDPHLPVNFRSGDISGRNANKTALQLELGLDPDPRRMLLGMVSRMDHQKGIDLALEALDFLTQVDDGPPHPWQAVILGCGSSDLEEAARQMQAKFPERIKVVLRYDPALSRMMYAGCDALLIPSRYEPCGLSQMIAMRYGCVPIAHATGGLQDTIRDVSQGDNASGFLFEQPTRKALASTIKKALHAYSRKDFWRKIQKNGMEDDFSWEKSAGEYIDLYRSLISIKLNKPAYRQGPYDLLER